MHKFVLLVDGKLMTYNSWESIPEQFDNVIEFIPEIPEGPHTHEQHEEIAKWNNRLQELLKKEKLSEE